MVVAIQSNGNKEHNNPNSFLFIVMPRESGHPVSDKYCFREIKSLASFISCFILSGIPLSFSGNILQKLVKYFEGCIKDAQIKLENSGK